VTCQVLLTPGAGWLCITCTGWLYACWLVDCFVGLNCGSGGILPGRLSARAARVAAVSSYGSRPGWQLTGVIVKSGDDCRQELLALQLIREFRDIWAGRSQQPEWTGRMDEHAELSKVTWRLL
jgi:hypothetical protein